MAKWPWLCVLVGVGCSSARGAGALGTPGVGAGGDAAELDALLERGWRAAGVTPAPLASDGEYLRRVSLDLVGRVPTLGETRAFLADPAPDKRARLVDRLLASPEVAQHFADVYSELLWRIDGSKKIEKAD